MCEIAVLDPERANLQTIMQVAYKLHNEQGDGVGFLSVEESPDGFSYETYCSINPHWQTFYSHLRRHYEDAWRIILHGRYQTAGEVNRRNAHPIEVDCRHCDTDYVIHNGSVSDYANKQASLSNDGHDFTTPVDSEVIAHTKPDDTEDLSDLSIYTDFGIRGKLNFLLFNEEEILVRNDKDYDLTEDFLMTCSRRQIENAEELGFERAKANKWLRATPGEDGPEIDVETQGAKYTGSSSSQSGGSRTRPNTYHPSEPNGWAASSDDEDTYTEVYEDLSEWDNISVIRVAPDVLKVIELNENEHDYLYRNRDPELYYWYAPEETPDEVDELAELADVREKEDDLKQTSISEHAQVDEDVLEIAVDDALRSVQEQVGEDLMLEEYAEAEESIRQALGA